MCPYKPWFEISGLNTIGCAQELVSTDLDSIEDIGRIFGSLSDECAIDVISTPTKAPATGQPTFSARPSFDINPCIVCSDGITTDPNTIVPGFSNATCEQAVQYVKGTFIFVGSDECDGLGSVEIFCCPTEATSPCSFCPDGLTVDEDTIIPSEYFVLMSCAELCVYE